MIYRGIYCSFCNFVKTTHDQLRNKKKKDNEGSLNNEQKLIRKRKKKH